MAEDVYNKNDWQFGTTAYHLGQLYSATQQFKKAEKTMVLDSEVTEITKGKEHWEYGISLNNLAGLYESMGDYSRALPLYLEANKNVTNQTKQIFRFRSEKEQKAFLKTVLYNYKIYRFFGFSTDNKL